MTTARRKVRSPQQKKRESYLHDRRNVYGETNKGSRRSIRKRKRLRNKSSRRSTSTVLATLQASSSEEAADIAEVRLNRRKGSQWRKTPDLSLGQRVVQRLERRVSLGIDDEAASAARIRRIRARVRSR